MPPVGALLVRVRADFRHRWISWLALAGLLGLFAGVVIAVAAGARRTDTAYPRLMSSTRSPDVMVVDQVPGDPSFATFSSAELAALPQVTRTAQVVGFTVLNPSLLSVIATTDRTVGYSLWSRKMLAGRLADPARPDEVTISFTVAEDFHLGVGDSLHLSMQPARGSSAVPVVLHIVGVDAAVSEFPPQNGSGIDEIWATPAFVHAHADLAATAITVMRLAHGAADGPAVNAGVARLSHGKPNEAFLFSVQEANTQHSIHLQAVALWILAGLLALVGLIVAGQLLARQAANEATGYRELRALGMSTRQLWAVGMTRSALIGAVAALVAAITAVAASPLFPLGLAGIAEPHPGLMVDAAAVAVGVLGTAAAVLVCAAWPNWRVARAAALARVPGGTRARPRGWASGVRALGAPVTTTVGVSFALDTGRGRSAATPVRTTLTAVVIGIAALTAAAVFSASLGHLLTTPSLYGTTWDALVSSNENEGSSPLVALPALRRDPSVDAITVGNSGIPLEIDGTRVDGLALDSDEGPLLQPTLVAGRTPEAADEVMLGTQELSRLHLHLGDTIHRVELAGVAVDKPLRVVGVAIFPTLSDDLGLGQGALLTLPWLRSALGEDLPGPDTILVRFRPGTDHGAAIARLGRTVGAGGTIAVAPPQKPVDLINFGRVQGLPLAVGAVLGLLGAGTLAHLLITSIRRRRRDLAVLKILGFVPAQLRRTVAWQASTVVVVATALGVPIGLIVGRWIWVAFARELGVVAVPTIPPGAAGALALGALVVGNLVAFVPAQSAARTRVSQILRTA